MIANIPGRFVLRRVDEHTRMMLAARVGWALAGVSLVAAFLARRRWWLWLTLPFVTALAPLSATGDWDAALAGFLAAGITLVGALAFGRRWREPYLLLAAGVLLVLLVAPDPYVALGLTCDLIAVAVLAARLFGQEGREERAATR